MPVEANFMLGMTDSSGRPVVCSGNRNPDPRACYVYDRDDNTWLDEGPTLTEDRDRGAVVRLPDGRYWITGGQV